MKIAIIGHGPHVLTKAIIKAVEERTDAEIVVVDIYSKDAGLHSQKPRINEVEPYMLTKIERYSLPPIPKIELYSPPPIPKRKGHERPYRYHR